MITGFLTCCLVKRFTKICRFDWAKVFDMNHSPKFSPVFGRKLLCKEVDVIEQTKALGTDQKRLYVNVRATKRGLHNWVSKIKRRWKRNPETWIAIATLVWEIFSTMLPYLF